ADEAQRAYDIRPLSAPPANAYDGIILAVAHHQFRSMGAPNIRRFGKPDHVLYDLKYLLKPDEADLRL
ncbi:Vi polysaccharide biosynthesis UDP-N-acetylglucosamine C-6 dehydrogenase TviB, partial [Azotobacter chroococcum]|nr:Vi polysaccharide biosynthesis UDP-N-acetylglucosamine C-6 dehydrogenase TviB [Azotobacter chroococcum]